MTEVQNRRPLTIGELKEATGLSFSTLRRRVKDKTIPVIQPGGPGTKLLFSPTIIDDLLAGRTRPKGIVPDEAASIIREPGSNLSSPSADRHQAEHPADADADPPTHGDITRPEAGPIPSWMQSPLLNRPKQ